MKRLRERLDKIKKSPYGAYKSLKGVYSFVDFTVCIEHVQGDPYAIPSNIILQIPFENSGYPGEWLTEKSAQIPLGDFLTRRLFQAFKKIPASDHTGNGGRFYISEPGQQIIPRSSVRFFQNQIEIRFRAGLPAYYRKVDSEHAGKMFFQMLPDTVLQHVFCQEIFLEDLKGHIQLYRDQMELRKKVFEAGYIGFVPNGSRLPRKSGFSDEPLTPEKAVPFQSPPELEVEFSLEEYGVIKGMGVRRGINLIVGGGFHGKSTLLEALIRGIYPHIRGDGREFVVTDDAAVNIRAENGRVVNHVNIDSFISGLPGGRSTVNFSSENASGSTSQAASISESIAAGAKVLLMDEDTCATNFMFRDNLMRSLVSEKDEPIKSFIHAVQPLFEIHGVSTILVMGAIGEYFRPASEVIGMKNFQPSYLTPVAKSLLSSGEILETLAKIECGPARHYLPDQKIFGEGKAKVKVRGFHSFEVGDCSVNIQGLEQFVSEDQVRAVGYFIKELMKRNQPFGLKEIENILIDNKGELFTRVQPYRGDLASVRVLDLAGAINRIFGLEVVMNPG